MATPKGEEYYSYMQFLPICEDNFDTVTTHHEKQYDNECNYICSRTDIDHSIFFIPCRKLTIYMNQIKNNLTWTDTFISCKYLNYRIHDELIKHKNDQSLDDVYAKLIKAYKEKNFDLNTICKENVDRIDEHIFEQVKKLFEIYNKFNKTLKGHSSFNNPMCSYINDAIDLYTNYGTSCSEQSKKIFCKALEAFRLYYQSSIGNINTKCTVPKLYLDSFQVHDSGTGEIEDLQVPLEEAVEEETESSTNYSTKKNMLTSFYIILPITFFSFILYKFTPIGSWFRSRILKKKYISNNLYEKGIELLQKPGYNETNSQDRPYNVQYQSSRVS